MKDEYINEKIKLKNTNYGPAIVYQKDEKTVPARVRKMMTGGDGTAYMGEAAVSQQQQKFMGMVYAYKKGEMPNASDEVKKAAEGMTMKEVEKYASTKHAKLPKKIEEKLDKNDEPKLKKLHKMLLKSSDSHKKQAKLLAKSIKEQLGGTGTKVAPSSEEMKKKLTVKKEPLTQQSLDARKLAQKNVETKMNQQSSFTTTNTKDGVTSMSVTGGKTKDLLAKQLQKSGTGVQMDADGLVPDAGATVQKQAEYGMNIARNTMSNNPSKFSDSQRKDFKTADNYLKSGQIKTDINKQIPGTQQFRYDIAADEINLASQKNKPNKNKGIKIGMQKEDITDEALTIQDWNVDDIKFTEIETIDIIKAKPLKESMSNWRDELDEDWQKVNRKDKTDGMSKAAVKAYRKENPGSKLKTAVTKDPKKLKKGSKDAKRRLSFCRRMKGMKKRLTSAKTARDPDSRINKALRRWNC